MWARLYDAVHRHGIPQYVTRWPYARDDVPRDVATWPALLAELGRRIQAYHHHSFVLDKSGWPVSLSTVPTARLRATQAAAAYMREDRKLPTVSYCSGGIGRMSFYRFVLPPGEGTTIRGPSMEPLIQRVNDVLDGWERRPEGLRGLVLDFRKHTGGSFYPIAHAFARYLKGVTLFAWCNRRPKRTDRVWLVGDASNGSLKFDEAHSGKIALSTRPPRIAVVLGRRTSSSGEIAAALFVGRPNVRSYGARTSGELSVNGGGGSLGGQGATAIITTRLMCLSSNNAFGAEFLAPDVPTAAPMEAAMRELRAASTKKAPRHDAKLY